MQREPEVKAKLTRQGSSSVSTSEAVRSVVGPVGSSSLSLPNVERAMLERQQSDDARSAKPPSSTRKESHRDRDRERERDREGGRSTPVHRSVAPSGLQSPPISSSDKSGGSRPTSPLGNTQTPKQSEVLHSFFQSLLKDKAPGGGLSGASRGSASRSNATGERKSAGQ
jgi:dynein light intermediate chain 1